MFRRLHVLETAINPFGDVALPLRIPVGGGTDATRRTQIHEFRIHLLPTASENEVVFGFVCHACFATWLRLFLIVRASPARRISVRVSVI